MVDIILPIEFDVISSNIIGVLEEYQFSSFNLKKLKWLEKVNSYTNKKNNVVNS